jgi:hypothetical protein
LQAVSGVRCSDADRERIAERLRTAAADGRLRMDELDDRLGGVYAARYLHELDALVADLPGAGRPLPAAGWLAVLAAMWTRLRLDLALLVGRGGSGSTRRRVVLAAVAALFVIGVIAAAIGGFGPDSHEFHGGPGGR